jgi:hypothetical protein
VPDPDLWQRYVYNGGSYLRRPTYRPLWEWLTPVTTTSSNTVFYADNQASVPMTNNIYVIPQATLYTTWHNVVRSIEVQDVRMTINAPVVDQAAAQAEVERVALAAAEHREQAVREFAAAQERRAAVQVRARSLLESLLSEEQRNSLRHHGRFQVTGSRGRRYCINANGQSGNVDLLDDAGGIMGKFCAHPAGYLPDPDAWAAQLLALMTDEEAFLRVANLHWGHRPVPQPA